MLSVCDGPGSESLVTHVCRHVYICVCMYVHMYCVAQVPSRQHLWDGGSLHHAVSTMTTESPDGTVSHLPMIVMLNCV